MTCHIRENLECSGLAGKFALCKTELKVDFPSWKLTTVLLRMNMLNYRNFSFGGG